MPYGGGRVLSTLAPPCGRMIDMEFHQLIWDAELQADWQRLLELAVAEDLGQAGDCTSLALVGQQAAGRAAVVARQAGIVAGLAAVDMTLKRFDPRLRWSPEVADGRAVQPGGRLGLVDGPARGILAAERVVLNLLGRLSGIATLTRQYVEAVADTKTRIYDTRKTTPGWRRLEKYAVRCGGGWNHRRGLFDAILIKDNHLAFGEEASAGPARYSPAEAVGPGTPLCRGPAGRGGRRGNNRRGRSGYAPAARRGAGRRTGSGAAGQHGTG